MDTRLLSVDKIDNTSEKHPDILRQNIKTVYPTLKFLLNGEEK